VKRISNNRDLFEAPRDEQITVTIEASRVPFQATFSGLESSSQWTQVQTPSQLSPIEIRRFTMPAGLREFFAVSYGFPPAALTDAAAKYRITISGGETVDGPNDIDPPAAGSSEDLPYQFNVAARVESIRPQSAAGVVSTKGPAKGEAGK
jgi:hypothetical protein